MSHKQQEGQDGISWRKELRNLSDDDVSIDEMLTADLLCVIYVTGIRSNDLREKLLEVTNPTIKKFDRVVDSFDRAKKQLGEMKHPASASQTSSRGRQRSNNKPPGTNSQYHASEQRQETSQTNPREELERNKTLQGNCFRCGKNDHLLADCPLPTHHTCSACGKRGHVRTAYSRTSANNTTSRAEEEEHQLTSRMSQMSINNPLSANDQHQL